MFTLAQKTIGPGQPPFLIAEMSGNHNQSLDKALAIVDRAADAGADAIKLQTYTADTLTIDVKDGDFYIEDPKSLWSGRSLYELYQEAYTPWEWHAALFQRARERGIICFSTPFDETSVDFLESLGCPFYKIASFENNHLPLLSRIARTGKPVIMSTGISELRDLEESVRVLRANGCKDLVLLKCTSTYPASPDDSHLNTLPHLASLFSCQVGLSDHTAGIGVALAAVALGATVIEKHFVLDRSEGGVDAAFSMEPDEFHQLAVESKRAFQGLGVIQYGIQRAEEKSRRFKRSIYVVNDLPAGSVLTPDNIRIIRPGMGLHPRYYETVLGKRLRVAVKRGTALSFDLLG